MVGWHHWLDGSKFDQVLRAGDGQESLECCSPWGHKESDMTEQLNWTKKCPWHIFVSTILLHKKLLYLATNSGLKCCIIPFTVGSSSAGFTQAYFCGYTWVEHHMSWKLQHHLTGAWLLVPVVSKKAASLLYMSSHLILHEARLASVCAISWTTYQGGEERMCYYFCSLDWLKSVVPLAQIQGVRKSTLLLKGGSWQMGTCF